MGKPRGGKGGVSGLGRGSGSGGGGRQGRGEGASLRAGGLEPSIQDSSVWSSGQAGSLTFSLMQDGVHEVQIPPGQRQGLKN